MKTNTFDINPAQEVADAMEAAFELEVNHPTCKNGHGLMWFDDGETEISGWGAPGYTAPPTFYCPKCGERKVIS